MKLRTFLLAAVLLLCLTADTFSQSYLTFGKTSRGDYETVTVLPLATRSDTAYSNVLWAPFPIGTIRLQANVTAVSTSDSLDLQVWASADDSTYTQITNPAFSAIAATGSAVITLTNAPKFLKVKYQNRGSAIANTFSVKAVAKP